MANPNSEAIGAMGTYLRRNGTEIAEVTNISGPSFKAETIEVTHLRSPGFWREYIGSLKDGGELTFDINMILANATHNAATGVLAGFNSNGAATRDTWDIVFPDAASTVWTMGGYITGYEVSDVAIDGKLSASITVQLSGKPTLA